MLTVDDCSAVDQEIGGDVEVQEVGLQTQFNGFDANIRITREDDRMRTIREKDDSIQDQIKEAIKAAGYSAPEFFQQGSYATQTSIVPLNGDYDIDVGIVVDASSCPEDPVEVKKVVRDVLKARNLKNPRIKMPCVTAQYIKDGEKQFHIDYAVFRRDNEAYALGVGKEFSESEKRRWETADPKGLINWINDKAGFAGDESFRQYKRLIRYLKRWRDFCFTDTNRKKIYSVGLNIMIRQCIVSSVSQDGDVDDLEALQKTVSRILAHGYFTASYSGIVTTYVVRVVLPVKPYSDVFQKHGTGVGTEFRNKLVDLGDLLERVRKETSVKKQSEMLAKDAFGTDFPVPEDDGNRKFKESGFVASSQGA